MKPKKRKSEATASIKEKSKRYVQLQISTDPDTREKLLAKIERLRERANKHIKEDEILFSRGDIAIEALKRGLVSLNKEI